MTGGPENSRAEAAEVEAAFARLRHRLVERRDKAARDRDRHAERASGIADPDSRRREETMVLEAAVACQTFTLAIADLDELARDPEGEGWVLPHAGALHPDSDAVAATIAEFEALESGAARLQSHNFGDPSAEETDLHRRIFPDPCARPPPSSGHVECYAFCPAAAELVLGTPSAFELRGRPDVPIGKIQFGTNAPAAEIVEVAGRGAASLPFAEITSIEVDGQEQLLTPIDAHVRVARTVELDDEDPPEPGDAILEDGTRVRSIEVSHVDLHVSVEREVVVRGKYLGLVPGGMRAGASFPLVAQFLGHAVVGAPRRP